MLIGLSGKKQSGKSSVANHFVDYHKFVRIRFAGRIKDMMRALGLSEDEIEGNLKEKPCHLLGGKTPRYAMQTLGTEWGRELVTPDLWIRVCAKQIADAYKEGRDVIIDDVRFANEASLILKLGGILFHIVRPGTETADTHASERFDFETHWEINNDDTLSALYRKIEDLVGL